MKLLKFAVLAVASAQPVFACDLCAIYAANQAHGEIGKGVFAGVAEQFTHFGTLQEDGDEVPDAVGQFLDSSITQTLLGHNFNERFGIQFNVPIIHRSFKRPEGFEIDRGTESGVGDVSLIGHAQVLRRESKNGTLTWNVLGGVRFPTGSSDRLREELDEVEVPGAPESGIHGHDLTLGSGSFDGVVGMSLYARWKRFFASASAQYAIRTQGDFDYRFANDLIWAGGPGIFVVLNESFTLSIQANTTGETKRKDEFQGEKAEDTGITSVFLGPEIVATWNDKLSVELGADIPVSIDNTALQIVPDYRLRVAMTLRF